MTGKERDHERSRLIHAENGRIMEFILHERGDGADSDPAGADKNKRIRALKLRPGPRGKSALRDRLIRKTGIFPGKPERVTPCDPQRRVPFFLISAGTPRPGDLFHRFKSHSRKADERYLHHLPSSPDQVSLAFSQTLSSSL